MKYKTGTIIRFIQDNITDQKSIETKIKKMKLVLQEHEVEIDIEVRIFVLEMMIELLRKTDQKDELVQYETSLFACYKEHR